MLSYQEQNYLLNDKTLLIVVDKSIIPFKGLIDFIDWQINATFSSAISTGIFNFEDSSVLMLNTEEKIGVNSTIILKNNKTLAISLSSTVKNLNVNTFTLLVPKTVNINLKALLASLKDEQLRWTKLTTKETKHERLVCFKEVTYGQQL